MAEVKIESNERKNPVHRAMVLLLTHLGVQQPEVNKETGKLKGELDELFRQEIVWQEAARRQAQQPAAAPLKGEPGAQGPQGEQGEQGNRGARGPRGKTGEGE
jgi:hypothetical protein